MHYIIEVNLRNLRKSMGLISGLKLLQPIMRWSTCGCSGSENFGSRNKNSAKKKLKTKYSA